MDLYTMNENFISQESVDEYVSAIWVERFWDAGDVNIVTPASSENIEKLAEGTFLGLRGSKEVMLLETQSIENNLLTIVGRSLPSFLETRFVWAKNPASSAVDSRVMDYSETEKPGQFLANLITKFAIAPASLGASPYSQADIDFVKDAVPGLTLGAVDTTGVAVRLTAPTGPLFDALKTIAEQNKVGFSLYLDFADPGTGFSLKFKTYQGLDRTSSQSLNSKVKLSPDFDSLSNLKEIRSIKDYRNVVYVYYQGVMSEHLLDPTAPEPEGFARRTLIKDAEGQPVGRTVTYDAYYRFGTKATTTIVGAPEIAAFREQNAKDAFANHNYIRAVDGETSPVNEYKWGIDYGMGDIIELESLTGIVSKARVTEYIRSEDHNGEKEYPTISVIS
jgi:hypothetical protein